jgi:hypothetical protein
VVQSFTFWNAAQRDTIYYVSGPCTVIFPYNVGRNLSLGRDLVKFFLISAHLSPANWSGPQGPPLSPDRPPQCPPERPPTGPPSVPRPRPRGERAAPCRLEGPTRRGGVAWVIFQCPATRSRWRYIYIRCISLTLAGWVHTAVIEVYIYLDPLPDIYFSSTLSCTPVNHSKGCAPGRASLDLGFNSLAAKGHPPIWRYGDAREDTGPSPAPGRPDCTGAS